MRKRDLYKIAELEAQIELNEMIKEDYQDDKVFSAGLQMEIDKWENVIKKLKANEKRNKIQREKS